MASAQDAEGLCMRMHAPVSLTGAALACTCAEATAAPVLGCGSLCSEAFTACRARPAGGLPEAGCLWTAGCANDTGACLANEVDERRGVLLWVATRLGLPVGSKRCTLLGAAVLADSVPGCARCACLDRASVGEPRAGNLLWAGRVLDCGRTSGYLVCGLLAGAIAEVGLPGVGAEGAAFKRPRAGGLKAPVPLRTDLITSCACDDGRVGGKVPTRLEAGFITEWCDSCLLAGGMRGGSGRDTAGGG